MFKKTLLLLDIVLLILAFVFFIKALKFDNPSSLNAICKNCNVILVSVDTLGSNHLPCYGYERNTSPNLCKFAKNNIIFTNSFSNASWTLPSHFSIFTSLYPKHHHMEIQFEGYLNPNFPTIAETLSSQNYETLYVGPTKDYLSLPLDRGLGRGFKSIISNDLFKPWNLNAWQKGFDELKENSKKGKKSFLFLHTYWVHEPYLVEEYAEKNKRLFTNKVSFGIPLNQNDFTEFSPEFFEFLKNYIPLEIERSTGANKKYSLELKGKLENATLKDAKTFFNSLTSQKKFTYFYNYYENLLKKTDPSGSYASALYDEGIYYLDKQLAELFSLVSDSQLSKNTIIIVTSDHGEEFMEHGDVGHGKNLYNSNISSPLILYIPGIRNKKITDLVQGIDIYPTILGLLGIEKPGNLEGQDLTDLITGKIGSEKSRFLISQNQTRESIRDDKWKLYIRYNPQRIELFDLQNDSKELNNLANANPKIVKKLSNALENIIYKK